MAEISDLIAELQKEHKEDQDHAAVLQSLEMDFPTQVGKTMLASGMISESTPGVHTELLSEIRRGVDGMKESLSSKIGNFVKGFSVFTLGFGASDRGRRKSAKESAHREALMQSDIKDLSEYFNRGNGLARALTEHQNKGVLGKMFGKGRLKQQEKEDEATVARNTQTGLLMNIALNTGGIADYFGNQEPDKEKDKGGLGIIIAGIAAPIVALVAFFNQLSVEFAFLKALTGKGLTKLFAPLKSLFTGGGPVGKAFAGIGRTIKAITDTIKTSKGFVAIGEVGTKIKGVVASLVKFMKPATDFFKSVVGMSKSLIAGSKTASTILKFASKFGTLLGKIFLPITILMSAFDFITGFMKGYEEDGILGGLKGGLTKLFQGLIGMPLDLLKKAVAWVLGVFGFKNAEKALNKFSFSELIGDIISGIFGMIKGAVDWVKLLFSDPVPALKSGWTGILGGFKSLTDMLFWPVNQAIAWVQKLFGWGDPAEPFTVQKFIGEVWTKIKTWFTNLFSWAATEDDKDSFVIKTIKTAVRGVKTWFTNLFSWAATEDDKDSFVVTTIKTAVDAVKKWLGNMFKFDNASAIITSAFNVVTFLPNLILTGIRKVSTWLLSLFGFDTAAQAVANTDNWTIGSMIVGVFKSVKDWFLGIFGFGTDEDGKGMTDADKAKASKGFSLSTMIGDAVKAIKEYFWNDKGTGLLNFDLAGALPDFEMPDFGEMIKGVVKAVFPTSLFDKSFLGYSLKDFLPDSLTKLLTEPDKKAAAGGSFKGGQSVLVGELGPEMILPSSGGQVMNAQRTAQMQESGLQRGAGGGGGAPTIVNAPVSNVNSSSNMTNTTTSFSHPSAILNTVNVAA